MAAILKFKIAAYTMIPKVILLVLLDSLTKKIRVLPPKPSFYEFPILKYWQSQIRLEPGGGYFEMHFLNEYARVGNSGSFDNSFSMII